MEEIVSDVFDGSMKVELLSVYMFWNFYFINGILGMVVYLVNFVFLSKRKYFVESVESIGILMLLSCVGIFLCFCEKFKI